MADEQVINETANISLNTSSVEKMLPKYCTSVQVALLNNAHIVLTMSYQEAPQPGILIERVIIDLEHANNLADILKTAVNEIREKKLH